jgi:hypothetical protein
MTTPIEQLEINELIDKLRANGYGDLIDAFLDQYETCTTRAGRLNKSALVRQMRGSIRKKMTQKHLDDQLAACRQLLSEDF